MNKSNIIGWAGGIIIWFVLSAFIPSNTCNDGTHSSSVGKRGACSWHHGVNHHDFLHLLVLVISASGGILLAVAHSGDLKNDMERGEQKSYNKSFGATSYRINQHYDSIFNGYSRGTPKNVIIQLLALSSEPDTLIDEVTVHFGLSKAEAAELAAQAKALLVKDKQLIK